MGETSGQPGERIAADLVRRPGTGGSLDPQVAIITVVTGGVAIDLDGLGGVLAPVTLVGRRPRGTGRRRAVGGRR